MLRVDCERWHQTVDILREQALKAGHARTRERFMAMYEICRGKSATQVGLATKRNPQTVMEWVRRYNEVGPQSLVYQHIDTDQGYGWSVKGERFWISSSSRRICLRDIPGTLTCL
jgi:hypothetical protein